MDVSIFSLKWSLPLFYLLFPPFSFFIFLSSPSFLHLPILGCMMTRIINLFSFLTRHDSLDPWFLLFCLTRWCWNYSNEPSHTKLNFLVINFFRRIELHLQVNSLSFHFRKCYSDISDSYFSDSHFSDSYFSDSYFSHSLPVPPLKVLSRQNKLSCFLSFTTSEDLSLKNIVLIY